MSTGYSWEGIRKVRATLLGARHVPELSAFVVAMSTWGAISSVRPLPLPLISGKAITRHNFALLARLIKNLSTTSRNNFQQNLKVTDLITIILLRHYFLIRD